MVGSAAIKQGRSANCKHIFIFWPKNSTLTFSMKQNLTLCLLATTFL